MEKLIKVNKWKPILLKYRYPAIILLLGILLMMLPGRKNNNPPDVVEPTEAICLEERLANMLSKIEGAGKVEVVLSVSMGEEIVYQIDHETDISDGDESIHSKTILISDSQRTQSGLVKQINPPIYLGAVITCQGADNPVVKLAIVDAVSTLTGLGADRISVLKMK